MSKEKIILGIDPGTTVMGYGLIRVMDNKPSLLAMGVLELNKYEDHYLRLRRIFERIIGLIDEFLPDELAIELSAKPIQLYRVERFYSEE